MKVLNEETKGQLVLRMLRQGFVEWLMTVQGGKKDEREAKQIATDMSKVFCCKRQFYQRNRL